MPLRENKWKFQIVLSGWFFFLDFIYLFVRESTQAGGAIRRGRGRLPAEQGAGCRTWSQDPGIMTWAKGRCLTDWATQASLYTTCFENFLNMGTFSLWLLYLNILGALIYTWAIWFAFPCHWPLIGCYSKATYVHMYTIYIDWLKLIVY